MFEVPDYSCIEINNDTTIYAYNQARTVRDTFRVSGLSWVKTATATSSYGTYNPSFCYDKDVFVPSTVSGFIILSAVIIILAFFSTILVWFRRVRR